MSTIRQVDDATEERNIVSVEMAENCSISGRNDIAATLANVVGQALDAMNSRRGQGGSAAFDPKVKSTAMAATSIAVGAVEGTLKGKGLQGAIAEAQIVREYAAAEKDRAEAERIRFDMAWAHLQNTLALYQSLGIPIRMVTLPDGRSGIAIGDGLALPLPGT
jgi:hypothetical protein